NLQEFLLLCPGLPTRQHGLSDVLSVGARQHELWAGFIYMHDEVKIPHRDFPRPATTARTMRARLVLSPRPGQKIDFTLVFVILAFPINAVNLQEIVNSCHCGFSSLCTHTETSRRSLPLAGLRPLCLPRLHSRMVRLPWHCHQ